MIDKKCLFCDFYDEDFECVCPPYEKWYACSLEEECTSEDFLTVEEYEKREKYKKIILI